MPAAADTKFWTDEADHLGEVAHRRLAAVGLPVGVGHEADRGVERQVGHDAGQVGRVERQRTLHPLQGVDREEREDAERRCSE